MTCFKIIILKQLISEGNIGIFGYASQQATGKTMSEKKSPSKFGYFFAGCLGAVAALFLVVAVALVGGYFLINAYLDDFTDSKPIVFNEILLSTEEQVTLKEKWSTFKLEKNLGLPTDPMELDADQLNHLIRTDPDFSAMKDKVHLQIEGTTVRTDISLPASMVKEVFPNIPNVGMFQNRYFNASAVVDLRLLRNEPAVYLLSLDMAGGNQIPDEYLNRLKNVDLLKDARFAGQFKKLFGNLSSLTVKDGKIMMIGSKGTLEEMDNQR
jgi:hypothetical protein